MLTFVVNQGQAGWRVQRAEVRQTCHRVRPLHRCRCFVKDNSTFEAFVAVSRELRALLAAS